MADGDNPTNLLKPVFYLIVGKEGRVRVTLHSGRTEFVEGLLRCVTHSEKTSKREYKVLIPNVERKAGWCIAQALYIFTAHVAFVKSGILEAVYEAGAIINFIDT